MLEREQPNRKARRGKGKSDPIDAHLLLLSGDDTNRHLARGTLTDTRLASLARRRQPRDSSREQTVRHAEIRRLALALRDAARELKTNRVALQTIVDDVTTGLTDRRGIGPVSAAQAIVSFSHPGRCRNDAAFAALASASPLQASSGRTVRHRLNRGGDRALNRAVALVGFDKSTATPPGTAPPGRSPATPAAAPTPPRTLASPTRPLQRGPGSAAQEAI